MRSTDGVLQTPLFYACWKGHVEAAALLLDRGAVVDAEDKWRCTPLIYAACGGNAGNPGCVQLLLSRGADAARVRPHACDNGTRDWITPLSPPDRRENGFDLTFYHLIPR